QADLRLAQTIAMQKVVGLSPISRFVEGSLVAKRRQKADDGIGGLDGPTRAAAETRIRPCSRRPYGRRWTRGRGRRPFRTSRGPPRGSPPPRRGGELVAGGGERTPP